MMWLVIIAVIVLAVLAADWATSHRTARRLGRRYNGPTQAPESSGRQHLGQISTQANQSSRFGPF